MSKYFMSIDLGTSSVKAFIADFENNLYYSEGENYDVIIPNTGYAEQNPEIWYEKTISAIRRVLSKSKIDPKQIIALSFSGQMHGLVALDENFNLVMNSIIWMDQRSEKVINEIYKIVGENEILANTQNRISAGFMIGTLYWLKINNPEIYTKIKYAILPKDYIKYRLSGRITTDYSDAAGSLAFNNKKLCWASPVLAKLGLNEDILPECFSSTHIVGNITSKAARETGLSEGTIIINGGGDSFMQSIGNGIISEGVFASNIGTAGQISTTSKTLLFDSKMRMNTFAHVIPNRWNLMAACLNGGVALKWIVKQILNENDYETVNKNIAETPAGCNGLFFLPYLSGERTPHMDSKARGVFFGLTLGHGRPEFERAVMEGVAFALNDCLNVLLEIGAKCDRIIAAGGGARSNEWLQIQADIFGRDVYRSSSVEQACLGAAITAAVGAGYFTDFESACGECVKEPSKVFHPKSENVAVYKKAYPIFRDIYQQNKEIFRRISV